MKKGIAIILILSIMMSLSACSHCWMKNPPNHGPRMYNIVIVKEDIPQGLRMTVENMSYYFTILRTPHGERYEGCLEFDTYTQSIHNMWAVHDILAGSPISLSDFTNTNPVDESKQYTLVTKKDIILIDIPTEDITSHLQFNPETCSTPTISIDMVVLDKASKNHAEIINTLSQGLSCAYKIESNATSLRFTYMPHDGRIHNYSPSDILLLYRSYTENGPSKVPVVLKGTATCSDHIHKFATYGILSVSMRIGS